MTNPGNEAKGAARATPRPRAWTPRRTRRGVRIADRFAGASIRVAGLGTIGAVSLVFLFLFSVAAPLMRQQQIVPAGESAAPVLAEASAVWVNDHQSLGWAYLRDGRARVFNAANGVTLEQKALFEAPPTAAAIDSTSGRAAFGFADGTVRLAKFDFTAGFENLTNDTPAALTRLAVGERTPALGGVTERISRDQLRVSRFSIEIDVPFAVAGQPSPGASGAPVEPVAPVVLIDEVTPAAGPALAVLTADCRLWLRRVYKRTNWLTGQDVTELSGGNMAVQRCQHDGLPDRVLLGGAGDAVYLLWHRGVLVRRWAKYSP